MAIKLLSTWKYWSEVPLIGKWIFDLLVSLASPYTGTLSMRVQSLKPGLCKATMKEWFLLRNPFRSVHAAALMNLGEATGGMAVIALCEAQHKPHRAIVTRITVEYIKKARGLLTAVTDFTESIDKNANKSIEGEMVVLTAILDASGELVCTIEATWTISSSTSAKIK